VPTKNRAKGAPTCQCAHQFCAFGQILRVLGAAAAFLPVATCDYNVAKLKERKKGEPTMPTDKTIDYIEMPAEDLDAAETFYSKTFGWKFQNYGPDYRAFNDGKMAGGFYRSTNLSRTANGAALVILYAADLEAANALVVANGGFISKDIFSFPGGRRFQFYDPNGNELGVWSE
jgi:uncharacterized protein